MTPHRTEEDLKMEKEIASRLKKAYKAAKATLNKKREKERERALANQPPNSTNLDLSIIREDHHLEDIPENGEGDDYEDDEADEEETEFVEVFLLHLTLSISLPPLPSP
jgi:hypothetical protein